MFNKILSLILIFSFSTYLNAGCGGAGAGPGGAIGNSGGSGKVSLGSNDLPHDMNYKKGFSPREQYISKYENVLKADPSNYDATKRLGIVYHHQVVIGDISYLDKAVNFLEKVTKVNPYDYESKAFLGSIRTLQADNAWNPISKLRKVKEGIKLIDEAVEKDPKNLLIRMVRANNSYNLPSFLGRGDLFKSDLLYMEKIANDPEANYGLPSKYGNMEKNDNMANVYYKLGVLYKSEENIEKAKEYFNKSIKSWDKSRWAKGAQAELDSLK